MSFLFLYNSLQWICLLYRFCWLGISWFHLHVTSLWKVKLTHCLQSVVQCVLSRAEILFHFKPVTAKIPTFNKILIQNPLYVGQQLMNVDYQMETCHFNVICFSKPKSKLGKVWKGPFTVFLETWMNLWQAKHVL